MFTIIHDKDVCIGCGACAVVLDEWEMKREKKGWKAVLKDATYKGEKGKKEVQSIGKHKEAAEVCPVNCIHIEEK